MLLRIAGRLARTSTEAAVASRCISSQSRILAFQDKRERDGRGAVVRGPTYAQRMTRLKKGCSVYVGNLDWSVKWQDLKDHMRQAGTVMHSVVMEERGTQRSKGCGVVYYSTPEEAKNAIATLHDSVLRGRPIFVREDREQYTLSEDACVEVSNLAPLTSWQDLKDHVRQAGHVTHCEVVLDPVTRECTGKGVVYYTSPAEAENAIRVLKSTLLNGQPLHIQKREPTTSATASSLASDSATQPSSPSPSPATPSEPSSTQGPAHTN